MPVGASAASLIIQVVLDAGKAGSDLDSLSARFSKIGSDLAGVAGKFLGGAAIAGFASAAINAASDLQESIGGVSAVFKENASDVLAWASDTSDSIRLPAAVAEQYATILGALLKNAGTPLNELSGKTHQLLQLANDLAATFGGTTERAAHALTSALKGNFNMMDEYGINLTALQVKQEAQAEATLTGADATSQAAKTQATMNLILKLSTDANGMAEKETHNYAAAVGRLDETWQNFLATVGTVALGSSTGFLDFLTHGLQLIEPFALALASLAVSISDLPAPILALGAAFGTMLLFGPKLAASMGGAGLTIRGEILAIQLQMQSLILESDVVAGGVGLGMGKMAAGVQVAGLRIKGALSTMFAGIGGIWGVAFMAATVIATIALEQWMNAAMKAKAIADAAKDSVQSFLTVLKSGGNLQMTAYQNLVDALKKLDIGYKTVGDAATEAGTKTDEMVKAAMGDAPAAARVLDSINKQIQDINNSAADSANAFSENPVMGTGATTGDQEKLARLQTLRDLIQSQVPALKDGTAAYNEYQDQVKKAGVAQDQTNDTVNTAKTYTDALKDSLDAAKKAAESTLANTFIKQVSDEASKAKRDAEIFTDYMSSKGISGNRNYQASYLSWADSIRALGGSFKDATDKGGVNADMLQRWDLMALAGTESGSKLTKSLTEQTDQYTSFVTAAFEATGGIDNMAGATQAAGIAADIARSQFVDMATGAGLTADQANALADQLGILDSSHIDNKVFDIIANDQQAAMTAKLWEDVKFDDKKMVFVADFPAAQVLADQMNTKYGLLSQSAAVKPLVVPTTIGPPSNIPPGAFGQVIMGAQATATTGTVNIPTTVTPPAAPPGPAGAAATSGAAQTAGTVNVPVTQTGAEAAASQVASISDTAAGKPVVLNISANANSANAIISALMNEARLITITTTANTGPADSLINSFMGVSRIIKFETFVNIGPAINLILSFMGVERIIRFSTTVDTFPVWNAIALITGATHRATVTIGANADAFWQVWNSLPTSRSIDIVVNQRQGTVVAPPAVTPGAFSAPAVPSLMSAQPMAAAASPSNVTYNVTVTGGLTDPDGAARAMANVLRQRERRATTVYVR